jgi:uncharacterized protein with von Willebrand factor type A (vWA) domain
MIPVSSDQRPVVIILDRSLDDATRSHLDDRVVVEDRFLGARSVAVDLAQSLQPAAVVTYDEIAERVPVHQLSEVRWKLVYGANLGHALDQAREIVGGLGPGLVVVVAYTTPTAHVRDDGSIVFNYPQSRETHEATVAAARRCAAAGLVIDIRLAMDASTQTFDEVASITGGVVTTWVWDRLS